MLRWLCAFVVLVPASMASAGPPPADWPFDVLSLKNGAVHKGLLLEETDDKVRFQIIRRAPGKPTVWLRLAFAKAGIAKLVKLSDEDRTTLKSKLEEIDPSPEAEARRLEKLDLKTVEWQGKKDGGLRYDSEYFLLISDAPEEIVRRAAYRLENVYAAYLNYLPPRFAGGKPTTIYFHQTMAGYLKAIPGGKQLLNPAFYEPGTNRIVCGSDLQKFGNQLIKDRIEAKQSLDEIAKQEAKVRMLYGKLPDLDRHLAPLKNSRAIVETHVRSNEEAFEKFTRQVFQTLYHEAFHSYVNNFVYPADRKDSPGELPRWLNEGMAQVFETAVFEAGELRIGHADRLRLEKAKDLLSAKELPSVKDILTAKPDAFAIAHAGNRPAADRAYIGTWALASYLMFDRRVLAGSALDDYVKSLKAGGEPMAAFEKLVGQPSGDFEKAFHEWLKRLQPNGSVLELGGK